MINTHPNRMRDCIFESLSESARIRFIITFLYHSEDANETKEVNTLCSNNSYL